MDGAVDYANYTLQQLREAEAAIDRSRFPINSMRLQEELQRRGQPLRDALPTATQIVSREPPRAALKAPTTLMCASIVLGFIMTIMDWRYLTSLRSAGGVVMTMVLVIALLAWLIVKTARGRNWARLTLLLLMVVGLPSYLFEIVSLFGRAPLVGALGILQFLLQVTAMYMLFVEPGRSEFRQKSAQLRCRLTKRSSGP